MSQQADDILQIKQQMTKLSEKKEMNALQNQLNEYIVKIEEKIAALNTKEASQFEILSEKLQMQLQESEKECRNK